MDATASPPSLTRLSAYRPPDWLVPDVSLAFDLGAERTLVSARLAVRRNGDHKRPLILDGDALELLSLKIDGVEQALPNDREGGLTLEIAGDHAIVETVVAIAPAANTRLMGLYASGGNLCTQCEAEGFRRITFFPDRPDVLSRYQVRMEADAAAFPVLLSNGNPGAAGPLAGGRHFAEWDDPHPKPSYLFALVAGALTAARDRFTTASGRTVDLAIWVAEADVPRTAHAMAALKAAMRFDEDVYGREYDLDVFNIVAVHDFNFGAMENKGLNIFNAKYVLADPLTATDFDLDAVSAIVAHEYFHNWSGNRVTCRDWFQLSLKEGFTVFRDQQFSAAIGSAAVRRIEDVRALRTIQFAEDAGPMAHPVQPDQYLEISNFYTPTIYNKGAELIRMMHRLLGADRFRRATDRYFEDNDGKAATIGDFLAAMESEGLDVDRFRRWYKQAGTPRIRMETSTGAEGIILRLRQSNPQAPDAPPLLIPLEVALFAPDGARVAGPRLVELKEREAEVHFPGVSGPVLLSVNRGFSAPILVEPLPDRAALAALAAHDDDPFARYDALQQLMLSALLDSIASGSAVGHADVAAAVGATLGQRAADPAFVAEAILLPSESSIGDRMDKVDPVAIHAAREALRLSLRAACEGALWEAFHDAATDPFDLSPRAKGLRRLKGVALTLLMAGDPDDATAAAFLMFADARGMTETMAALMALSHSNAVERLEALRLFRARHGADPALLDKWFLVQAASTRTDTEAVVRQLLGDPAFDLTNPNRARALLLGFAGNQPRFSTPSAFALVADQIRALDAINPQTAARLALPLARWKRMVPGVGAQMRRELERLSEADLSKDVREIVGNALS
jgi:aminopeptidase N